MTNPILKELHDIRKQILAEHGDDLGEYLRAALENTKASGHPVAKIKQRTMNCIEVGNEVDSAITKSSLPTR